MTAAQRQQVTTEALKYVGCIRTHGIPNMPDPVVNGQGVGFRFGGPTGNGLPPGSAVIQKAMHACQKLFLGGPP